MTKPITVEVSHPGIIKWVRGYFRIKALGEYGSLVDHTLISYENYRQNPHPDFSEIVTVRYLVNMDEKIRFKTEVSAESIKTLV